MSKFLDSFINELEKIAGLAPGMRVESNYERRSRLKRNYGAAGSAIGGVAGGIGGYLSKGPVGAAVGGVTGKMVGKRIGKYTATAAELAEARNTPRKKRIPKKLGDSLPFSSAKRR